MILRMIAEVVLASGGIGILTSYIVNRVMQARKQRRLDQRG